MAAGRKRRFSRPSGVAVWATLSGLLALGLLTTVIDFAGLGTAQTRMANEARQRYMVNPISGEILIAGPKEDAAATHFDVASADEAKLENPAADPDIASEPATEAAAPDPIEPQETVDPSLPEGTPRLRLRPNDALTFDTPRDANSLVAAPAPEISENVGGLVLPKRGKNEVTPSRLYAHPFQRKPEQVPIAFMVTDVGFDRESIAMILTLPPEISVAYSPYRQDGEDHSEALRRGGHEVWTMLPVISERYPSDDPGPLGLLPRMTADQVIGQTQKILAKIPGSVGVMLPADEAVTPMKEIIAPALQEISSRGLLVGLSHPSRTIEQVSSDKAMAESIRRVDLVLDTVADEPQIKSKLNGLIAAAGEKGEYSVTLSARPQSLALLAAWLKENPLPAPFVLAPFSGLYQSAAAPVEAAKEADGHGGGHSGGEKKKEKAKPKEKKQKPLIQDQYKQPAQGAKDGSHGGGGGH